MLHQCVFVYIEYLCYLIWCKGETESFQCILKAFGAVIVACFAACESGGCGFFEDFGVCCFQIGECDRVFLWCRRLGALLLLDDELQCCVNGRGRCFAEFMESVVQVEEPPRWSFQMFMPHFERLGIVKLVVR